MDILIGILIAFIGVPFFIIFIMAAVIAYKKVKKDRGL